MRALCMFTVANKTVFWREKVPLVEELEKLRQKKTHKPISCIDDSQSGD